MIFGTIEQKNQVREFVNRRHSWVNDTKRGNTYNAYDTELQLWVAATLFYTYIDVFELFVRKLDDTTKDKAYQEFSIMATSLQVPLSMWPKDRPAFYKYWDSIIDKIEVIPEARITTNELFNPKYSAIPVWHWPFAFTLIPLNRCVAAENLPPKIRDGFGIKSTATTRSVYKSMIWVNSIVYPLLPRFMREWSKNYYLKVADKKLGKKGNWAHKGLKDTKPVEKRANWESLLERKKTV